MAYNGRQFSAYGSTPGGLEAGLSEHIGKPVPKRQLIRDRRMRMTILGFLSSLFFPWIMFIFLYAVATFSIHYDYPEVCWLALSSGLGVALVIGAVAAKKFKEEAAPSWLMFLFFTTLLAAILGPLLGSINFWTNTQPYYDLVTLNSYTSVDPAKAQGQAMMDAGKVQFVKGTTIDLAKAYRFQNIDNYCVAPVSLGNASSALQSYDFWAIGLNCCGFNVTKQVEYKCGLYKSKTARQGLRLMNDNQRNYYRLAVQQAEAAHKITAKHPLMFYWAEDAAADMVGYYEYGLKYFRIGVLAFFALHVFNLLVTSFLFAKLGY